tara:strand:+ start:400 stop:966 length:567 start_codon:yes stop_codon:yes gene_type:complete
MYQKIYKVLFIIIFCLAVLFISKPIYFYTKLYFINYLLNDSWNSYKEYGIKKYSWLSVDSNGKLKIPNIFLDHMIIDNSSGRGLEFGVEIFSINSMLYEKNKNIVLAAHRDTFFKKLENISIYDEVVIEHIEGETIYEVENTYIIDPQESDFSKILEVNDLFLITCFPFDYIGDAPKRFVVKCKLKNI